MWSLQLEFQCKIRVYARGRVPEATPFNKSLRLVPFCVTSPFHQLFLVITSSPSNKYIVSALPWGEGNKEIVKCQLTN